MFTPQIIGNLDSPAFVQSVPSATKPRYFEGDIEKVERIQAYVKRARSRGKSFLFSVHQAGVTSSSAEPLMFGMRGDLCTLGACSESLRQGDRTCIPTIAGCGGRRARSFVHEIAHLFSPIRPGCSTRSQECGIVVYAESRFCRTWGGPGPYLKMRIRDSI